VLQGCVMGVRLKHLPNICCCDVKLESFLKEMGYTFPEVFVFFPFSIQK